jgi:hypothetical protein
MIPDIITYVQIHYYEFHHYMFFGTTEIAWGEGRVKPDISLESYRDVHQTWRCNLNFSLHIIYLFIHEPLFINVERRDACLAVPHTLHY